METWSNRRPLRWDENGLKSFVQSSDSKFFDSSSRLLGAGVDSVVTNPQTNACRVTLLQPHPYAQ